MSCLDMQEAPGRQAVGSVQAGRPEAGQAVCVQQPGESPLQRLETLSARQQEEQKAAIQREAEEIYLNTKQVRELLNVCDGTLNLWAKRGYLVPVKVGNKNMYAKSDVRRVQTGNKSESVTSYCKRKEK